MLYKDFLRDYTILLLKLHIWEFTELHTKDNSVTQ